jgi:ABC-type nickel/cobalt efflux system permease component RcnA
MNAVTPLAMLAALPPDAGLGQQAPGSGQDFLIVLIACAALGLVILGAMTLWLQSRKHRRHRHRSGHHRPEAAAARGPAAPDEEDESGTAAETSEHSHGRRRRRRAHRGRNPTLAETGGLPPPRPDGQVPTGL